MQWQPVQLPAGVAQQQVILQQQPMTAMTPYQQQVYWQQCYPQWTAVPTMQISQAAVPPQQPKIAEPPLPDQSMVKPPLPPDSGIGINPAPPVEPPKEEKPPLPPEPPPPEPTPPAMPTGKEAEKLSNLQAQAAQWQQQQQWQKYQQEMYAYQQQLQQWQQQHSPENIQKNLDSVRQEEAEFERSYSDWLKQYNDWKIANRNHPNQDQYKQYEQQWKTYETQMNQKRQDIDQRKSALQNQLKQVQTNAPSSQTPQMQSQWNNPQNPGSQWDSQRTDGYSNRRPDQYHGGSQFPDPRGSRNQGPRFDGPYQANMGAQRIGGARHRYEGSGGEGPRYDGQFDEGVDNSFQYQYNYDESSSHSQGPTNNRGGFDIDSYDNQEQYNGPRGNRFHGPRGGGFGGPRNSRFDSRGSRFEPRNGDGRGAPRPGTGPVPLMALNIEKPRSLDTVRNEDISFNPTHRNNRGRSPDKQPSGNADEELLAKMGLPTSFGGNMNELEEQSQNSNQMRSLQTGNSQKSRWGPRDPAFNRQSSQGDQQFSSAGPRGPQPREPLYRDESRSSHQDHERDTWERNRKWDHLPNADWECIQRDKGPTPRPLLSAPSLLQKDTQQKEDAGVDTNKIQLSDEQVKMIKGVTQELSFLRDQKEKLEQLQKLQDVFGTDKQPVASGDKAKEEKDGVRIHDYAHGGNAGSSRTRPGEYPPDSARRDPWADRLDERRPPPFDDPYYRYPPPPPHDPYYDPYRRGYDYYDRYSYPHRDPFARGRSPPRIPGAEGPVEVVDYGHGEDRNKRSSPVNDPWAKDSRPEDPWARNSRPVDDPWDRRGRDRGSPSRDADSDGHSFNYLKDRDDNTRDSMSPFSRDRGPARGARDSRQRERDPWERDDRTRGRDWRERSPVRDRDRDRRKERSRYSPVLETGRDNFGREKTMKNSGDGGRDRHVGRSGFGGPDFSSNRYFGGMSDTNTKIESVSVEDLLCDPGRKTRPKHLVVILRGLPGSGKSHVAKLLKDKEVSNGGGAPRILSIDDYFMAEHDTVIKDPDTGKKITKTEMKYEYEAEMEEIYRQNLLKSFKKQIDNLLFNFIIVDSCNEKVEGFEDFWSYAKSKGFQVYVVEIQAEPNTCFKRNTHGRTLSEILRINEDWEETPRHYLRLDIRTLLQDIAITEVEMEEATEEPEQEEEEKKSEDDDDDVDDGGLKKSRWELDVSEARLDQLDGIKKRHSSDSSPQHMMDYLQLPDDYETRSSAPGKKRVRWADIEERKNQERAREIGFVVGQTDWNRIMDDNYAQNALNRTKYI